MKTTTILLFCLLTLNSFGQIRSVWKGNTPGHEKDWSYPANWSNNMIPDEFTDVVIQLDISVRRNYPVLMAGKTEINSLNVWPGASITIKQGELIVLDPLKSNFNRIQIIGKGRLIMTDDPHYASDGTANKN